MPNTRTTVALALAVAGAIAVPAIADTPGDTDTTKTSKDTQTRTCQFGTVTLAGPRVLFPPNHKMVTETGTATDTSGVPATGLASLTLSTADVVDDLTGGDGSPTNGPDSSITTTTADGADGTTDGVATAPYQVRAERSGKGDGRTYTINWSATFNNGTSCSSTDSGQTPFTVTVPHDQGQS